MTTTIEQQHKAMHVNREEWEEPVLMRQTDPVAWTEWLRKHEGIVHVLAHGEDPEAFGNDTKPKMPPLTGLAETSRATLAQAWMEGAFAVYYVLRPDATGKPECAYILLKSAAIDAYEHGQRTPEAVDHPAHYGGKDDPYEVIKVLRAWFGDNGLADFCLGNAIKYIARAGKKDKTKLIEDLRKARWYLDYAITILSGE